VDRALQELQEVDAFWKAFDDDNRYAGVAAHWLGHALMRAGRPREAASAFSRAQALLQGSPFPADRELSKRSQGTAARAALIRGPS
jgi:TolA-binding protein